MGSTPTSGIFQVDYISKSAFSKPLSQGLIFRLRAAEDSPILVNLGFENLGR